MAIHPKRNEDEMHTLKWIYRAYWLGALLLACGFAVFSGIAGFLIVLGIMAVVFACIVAVNEFA